MASVNKVHLLGNIGRDPEVKHTPSGSAVCVLSIATSRSWKNKDTGEKQEETEWSRVVFYDRLAEIVGEYCQKGKPIYVEGRLKTRKWFDKENIERYTTEIIATELQLLGGRDGGESGGSGDAPQRAPQAAAAPRQAPAQRPAQRPVQRQAAPSTGFDDMIDDIPF